MTWEQLENTARHYAELAQQPGWFQHCKQMVIEMEALHNGHCWPGLRKKWGALLKAAGYQVPENEKDGWWNVQSQHQRELQQSYESRTQGRHR